MKKVLSVVVLMAVLVSCFSWAGAEGDFELRSGILFGDTVEEVKAKETKLTPDEDDETSYEGDVAGYSGVSCDFTFDETTGGLIDMEYGFVPSICSSRDTMDNVYSKLYQSLARQYGSPLGNTGGSCYIITGEAVSTMAGMVGFCQWMDGWDGNFVDYDEWIVDCDGYHVKIDLISYYWRDSSYDYFYNIALSYHYFTDEDLDDAMNEKQEENDSVDDDL